MPAVPVAESADKIVVSKINMDSPLINVTGPAKMDQVGTNGSCNKNGT